MLSSAEPENENKLQMVSTGYFVEKKKKTFSLKKDKKKPWLGWNACINIYYLSRAFWKIINRKVMDL